MIMQNECRQIKLSQSGDRVITVTGLSKSKGASPSGEVTERSVSSMWCFVCRSGRLAGEEAGPELQVWGLAGRSGGQPGQRHAVEPAV